MSLWAPRMALNASGPVRQGEGGDFEAGIPIAMYQTSGDPLTRYDRRRFQLVTPSRVASGGVFVCRGGTVLPQLT